jgi:hypothetical protein
MTLFVIPALFYQVFLYKRGWIGMLVGIAALIPSFMVLSFII